MSFNARYLTSTPDGRYPEMGDVTGRWYLAKPIPDPLVWRIRQAWKVVTGKAHVIYWTPESNDNQGGMDE